MSNGRTLATSRHKARNSWSFQFQFRAFRVLMQSKDWRYPDERELFSQSLGARDWSQLSLESLSKVAILSANSVGRTRNEMQTSNECHTISYDICTIPARSADFLNGRHLQKFISSHKLISELIFQVINLPSTQSLNWKSAFWNALSLLQFQEDFQRARQLLTKLSQQTGSERLFREKKNQFSMFCYIGV